MDPALVSRHLWLVIYALICVLLFFGYKNKKSFSFPPPVRLVFLTGLLFAIWNIFGLLNAVNSIEGFFETGRSFFHLLLLAIVVFTGYLNKNAIGIIAKTIVCVAIFHSLVGLMQYFNLGFTDLPGAQVERDVYGFMVNRNLYSSFIVLCLPFVFICYHNNKGFWKILSAISLCVSLGAIFISQTRSAWVAAAGSIILSVILIAIYCQSLRVNLLKKSLLIFGISILFMIVLIVADSQGDLSNSLKEKFTGTISALQNKTDTSREPGSSSDNVTERLKYWKKSIELIKDNPVLGVGRDNWKLSVVKYGYADIRTWAGGFFIPDHPHNVYLAVASETGLPGLLFFLAFWISIAFCGFKSLRSTTDETKRANIIFLLSGLFAFSIDCMFSFPDTRIEHMLLLLILGGFLLSGYWQNQVNQKEITGKPINKLWLIPVLIILAFNLEMGIKKMQYEEHYNLVKVNEASSNWQGMIDESEEAKSDWVNLSPKTIPVENLEIIAYSNLKKYPEAWLSYKKAIRYNPSLAAIYNNVGTVLQEQNKLDSAYQFYEKALKIAPMFMAPMKNMIVITYNLRRYDSCLQIFHNYPEKPDSMLLNILSRIVFENYQSKNYERCVNIIKDNKLLNEKWFDSLYSYSNRMILQKPVTIKPGK